MCLAGTEVLWRQVCLHWGMMVRQALCQVHAGRGEVAGGWIQMEHQINSYFL